MVENYFVECIDLSEVILLHKAFFIEKLNNRNYFCPSGGKNYARNINVYIDNNSNFFIDDTCISNKNNGRVSENCHSPTWKAAWDIGTWSCFRHSHNRQYHKD